LTLEHTPEQSGEDINALISDIRGQEDSQEQVTETSTPPEPAETVEEPPQEDESEAEARRNAILREIAIDPNLTQQYAQRQQAPQQEEAPALPFDEFSFDPNNPQHMQALLDARLAEVGGPLFEKINSIAERFEQEEQQRQAQHYQQVADAVNQKTVEFLDTYVPSFAKIAEKFGNDEPISAIERAVFNEAVNAESAMVIAHAQQLAQQHGVTVDQAYHYAINNPQIRTHIAQQIGPHLKKYASELGLVAQPKAQLTPEAKQQMKQEMYVESSNAVPASTVSSFEKALEKGDELSMIRALRAK